MNTNSLDQVSQYRKNNLSILINKFYNNINDFCVKNNEDYSAIHRYNSGSLKIGNNVVKRFERIFNLMPGELDKPSEFKEFIPVPIYSTKGAFTSLENLISRTPNTYAQVEGFIFQEYKVAQKDAIGITCDNESMHPGIQSGWTMLVDLSETEIIDGKTYALLYNNNILFRKVFISENIEEILLIPNNKEFKELSLQRKDVTIIGRPKYILGGSYDK